MDGLLNYYAEKRREKRAVAAQQRRLDHAKVARQYAINEAEYWIKEAYAAREIKQYAYSNECFDKAEAMKDARAGAVHEILQRRKAMGF